MPKTLEELRTRQGEIEARLKTLNTEAGDAALNDEQSTEWTTLEDEHRGNVDLISEHERRGRVEESRKKWGTVQAGVTVEPFEDVDVRSLSQKQLSDRSRKVLDLREHGNHLKDFQRSHAEKVLTTRNGNVDGDYVARLLLATHNEHYRSAFMKRMVYGDVAYLTPEEGRAVQQVTELRAMAIGSDGAGGFAVPVLIDPTVVLTAQGSPNPVLQLARIETVTNDVWKGIATTGVAWQFKAEATATTDNSPTISQPEVPVHFADGYIPYSIEVGMDWPGFATEMNRLLDSGYQELLADKLTIGTGTNQPTGIVTALDANTNVERATATGGTIAAADIYDHWDALPIRYRMGERTAWMSSTDVMNSIRQLGTVDPNFTVNLTAAGIAPLFNAPYPANDYMADLPAGTAAGNLLIVGDWVNYLVAQRAGMSVELQQLVLDVTNNRPTGQRAWYAWARVGADSINDLGFRLMQNKTS